LQLVLFAKRLEEYDPDITIEGKERLSMIKSAAMLIAAMAIAVPAHAQEARVDPEHIMTVLKDAGYDVENFSNETEYRQILSKSGDYQFLVEMYDCVDGKACQTLEFYSNYPKKPELTKELVDAYSGPREGARITLNRAGDATIRQELDINREGGLSDEQFIEQVKAWETMLGSFFAYLSEPAGTSPAAETAADATEAAADRAPAGEVADAT
jgi:hypothetical protein